MCLLAFIVDFAFPVPVSSGCVAACTDTFIVYRMWDNYVQPESMRYKLQQVNFVSSFISETFSKIKYLLTTL